MLTDTLYTISKPIGKMFAFHHMLYSSQISYFYDWIRITVTLYGGQLKSSRLSRNVKEKFSTRIILTTNHTKSVTIGSHLLVLSFMVTLFICLYLRSQPREFRESSFRIQSLNSLYMPWITLRYGKLWAPYIKANGFFFLWFSNPSEVIIFYLHILIEYLFR